MNITCVVSGLALHACREDTSRQVLTETAAETAAETDALNRNNADTAADASLPPWGHPKSTLRITYSMKLHEQNVTFFIAPVEKLCFHGQTDAMPSS